MFIETWRASRGLAPGTVAQFHVQREAAAGRGIDLATHSVRAASGRSVPMPGVTEVRGAMAVASPFKATARCVTVMSRKQGSGAHKTVQLTPVSPCSATRAVWARKVEKIFRWASRVREKMMNVSGAAR